MLARESRLLTSSLSHCAVGTGLIASVSNG